MYTVDGVSVCTSLWSHCMSECYMSHLRQVHTRACVLLSLYRTVSTLVCIHLYMIHALSLRCPSLVPLPLPILPSPSHMYTLLIDTGLSTGVVAGVVIGSVIVSVMIFIAGCVAGVIAHVVYQKTSKQIASMCSCLSTSMCSCLSTSVYTLAISPHHSLQNPLNLQKIR